MSTNPATSSDNGSGGSGSGGGGGGPCGACKFLRRKCVQGCIFAPYFNSDQGAAPFAAVHKVFGASNVSKLLLHVPVHKRLDTVVTTCYEAQARLRDPIYGCVAHIFALQQQVVNLQAELSYLQAQLAILELPPPPPTTPPPLSIADLPSFSSTPASYDLSTLFHPAVQPSGTVQQRLVQPRPFGSVGSAPVGSGSGSGGGDLQALARDFLNRNGASASCTKASSSPPLTQ